MVIDGFLFLFVLLILAVPYFLVCKLLIALIRYFNSKV